MENPEPTPIQNKPKFNRVRWIFGLLLVLLIFFIFFIGFLFTKGYAQKMFFGFLQPNRIATVSNILAAHTATPSPLPTSDIAPNLNSDEAQLNLGAQPFATITTETEIENSRLHTLSEGNLVLSYYEGLYAHLFIYLPDRAIFTRLTSGNWDDITPSVNPSGTQIAFASNRGGFWDIFILELSSGEIYQLTNTKEYDASPAWSPDGKWLVYESYVPDPSGFANLELMIQELNPTNHEQAPLRLTNRVAADFSPAWSPDGRMIVFGSIDEGKKSIWLADLDSVEDRLKNVSSRIAYPCSHPSWSPDGETLLWSSTIDGLGNLYLWKPSKPELAPQYVGVGDWATWDASGNVVITLVETPNQSYLSGFSIADGSLVIAPIKLGGSLAGLDWALMKLPDPIPAKISESSRITSTPAWQVKISSQVDIPHSHLEVIPLGGVTAPFPYLHDLVDETFQGLRQSVIEQIDWDYLSVLENAYVPLTSPLSPGMLNDWLYTGRAFAASTAPSRAGWLVVVREDFGNACYWRVFLRTRYQDGSQGMPLKELPWDFSLRLNGNPLHYEQGGGTPSLPPSGYWLDFTRLSSSYGWERLPALSSWRVAPQSARYNEYVYQDGLDWYAAMLEIYPKESVITVTPPPPPTATPTRTPIPSPTATSNLSPTAVSATLNPTEVIASLTAVSIGSQATPSP